MIRNKVTQEIALTPECLVAALGAEDESYIPGRTITHGSLKRGTWKLSWPILITTLCLSVVDLVHVQVAGLLSSGSQAIIGICDQILLLCVLMVTSLSNATTAIVSKSLGGDGKENLAIVTAQTLRVSVLSALLLMILINLLAPVVLPAFSGCVSNCNATVGDGQRYLGLAALYLIPFAFVSAINAAFVGTGNAKVQLLTLTVMAIVDICCNYLLVAVQWPVRGLGITGIAIASLIAYSLASLVAGFRLMASELRPRFTELLKNERAIAGELLKLGLPPALQEIAWTSSTFVLFWILALSKQPSEAVAAWTIGQRLEAFALLPLTTMAVAILVIVGQNVGAGRVQRAWNASWGVVGVGMALMVAVGVAFFFLSDAIAAMANPTAEAKPYVVTYLRMVALGLPFAALETLLGGSLQALDDTRIPMIIGFVSNWVVSLPPMYWLSVVLGYGPSGAWVAILLSTITSGSLIAWRFRSRPIWRAFGVLPAGESDPRTQ